MTMHKGNNNSVQGLHQTLKSDNNNNNNNNNNNKF